MIDTPRYKELHEQLGRQTSEQGCIDTLLKIGEEVKNFDVDHAIQIAVDVISRSRRAAYARGIGAGLCLKGFCNRLKGEYDAGIEVLKEALAIAQKIKDRNIEATALYYLGNTYRDLGDLGNVFSHYEKALTINEELGEEFYQSVILSSISNLLYDLDDFESALEYALKCLPIFERVDNVNSLLNIYNTLGNIYFKMEQYAEALNCFEQNINRSEPETAAYVMAESGVGKVYYKMKNFASAEKSLSHALHNARQIGNAEVQIICWFYLGHICIDQNEYQQALQHLNAAYNMASEYMRRHDLISIHVLLAELHDKMGNIPMAFHHLKSYQHLKEDIFKQTIINELRNLQVKQQIELVKKEKEVAERTARLKHQFLANMSHEIRTPMNAIVGMTRLLLAKDPLPGQLRYLNAIRLSSNNLLVIINDILDLSKIEAGKIIIEHTAFLLREVMQSLNDMLMLKAEEKHIEFRVTIDPDIPKRLVGDPTRLNQVLVNLAGNAIKFTEKGSVEIHASLDKKENGKLFVRFDVTDSGIGIAAEHLDSIFDSFTQAGSDTTRKFGGTGLGLTISRQLVTLMDGALTVASKLNEGTTFTATVPFEEADVQEEEKTGGILDDSAMSRLNRLKVLLVEDNEFNRMVAEDTLMEIIPGMTLHMAVNGVDAVNRLQKEMFDVVLMDIQMPVMNGIEATKVIRSTLPEPARSVKIIAMTANVMQEDVQQYFDTGMNAYVSKPFNPDELLLKMDMVMNNATPVAPQPEKPVAPPPPPLPAQVTDMHFLKQFTGGNVEKLQKYKNMFLENAPKLLNNLDGALAAKDYQTIKIAAHSLKPQLSYMGVKEEVSKIFLIEQSAGEPAHYDTLPQLVINLKHVCNKAFDEIRTN